MPAILCGDDGRPGLAPGIYFRLLLVGYFEGIDSERGISWRAGDSLSIREFVGIPLNQGGRIIRRSHERGG